MHRQSPRGFFALLAVSIALVASAESRAPATPPSPKAPAPARQAPKTAPPVTSLDVTVTDPAGRPVEGAFVAAVPAQGAYRSTGGLATEKVRSTLTGREGKARLESLPPGPRSRRGTRAGPGTRGATSLDGPMRATGGSCCGT
jgi:protocatechuate 3,4-dioxygenase beta subunit